MNTIQVTPQQAKIREFITRLQGVSADQFIMHDWKIGEGCNTVACIGGWAEIMGFRHYEDFGVNAYEWDMLCHMGRMFSLIRFDSLPAELRKTVMIEVLEDLYTHGKASWPNALTMHLTEEQVYHCSLYDGHTH